MHVAPFASGESLSHVVLGQPLLCCQLGGNKRLWFGYR